MGSHEHAQLLLRKAAQDEFVFDKRRRASSSSWQQRLQDAAHSERAMCPVRPIPSVGRRRSEGLRSWTAILLGLRDSNL